MAEYLCEEDMSTAEYISRDAALRQLNATCLATGCNNYNGVMCIACPYADAMDFIRAMQVADVQPVKHGWWIWDSNAPHREHGAYKCSNCGCHSDFEENYCYNCGARMDGDAE